MVFGGTAQIVPKIYKDGGGSGGGSENAPSCPSSCSAPAAWPSALLVHPPPIEGSFEVSRGCAPKSKPI
eukprot:3021602-Pyramimonas_sp.AAC.1